MVEDSGWAEEERMIVGTTGEEKHLFYQNYCLTPSPCLQTLVLFSMVNSYKLLNE
jgi:hypothetical protein